ncbi:hypothetical protein IAR55_000350 [Kwoniella newhampshirensis]|uniref:Endoplasmic reticulum protein n=1 Tax=Kwoniella newhampshirensis TaxID=1651941 RepID=A0AAW0Z6K6_9TREE
MLQNASEILSTTWSAVEAAVSVILVLVYGYYSRKINLLSEAGEGNVSHLCVTIFLPALLFSEIGPLASWSNLKDCKWWAIEDASMGGATSLPLLLLTSLGKNGTLAPLIGDDDLDQVLSRGRVYLLINALVCNLTRFTFGPKSPHALKQALMAPSYPEIDPYPQESAPLLGQVKEGGRRGWKVLTVIRKHLAAFMNPPMYGGLAAVVAGLIPFLRGWLFDKKGFLSPFAESMSNLGSLYTVLQMFVLGAHLRSKKGSRPPTFPLLFLFIFRFLVMAVISISVVYGVRKAAGSRILDDPVLDFVMMIAPVGPPALTLAATIVLSYVLTPLISVSVTAALSVVQALN